MRSAALVVALAACGHAAAPAPTAPTNEVPVAACEAPTTAIAVATLRASAWARFDTDVTVVGVVTFVYDCATDLRARGVPEDEIQAKIDAREGDCARPSIRIADAAGAGDLRVVEMPHEYTLAVGDRVVVDGVFEVRTPHGDADTAGLLEFRHLLDLRTCATIEREPLRS